MKAIVSVKNKSTITNWAIAIIGPDGLEDGWLMAYIATREEIETSIHEKYPGILVWYFTSDLA